MGDDINASVEVVCLQLFVAYLQPCENRTALKRPPR